MVPAKWVFIVGNYNSGTTLLDVIFQKHKSVKGFQAEAVVLTGHLNRPEDFTWQRMWCECYDEVRLDASPMNEKLAEKIKRHWSHFVKADKDKLLVEKSIVNATRIPFFNAFFKPAYFIYLVRNGYAVSEGIQRKARPGNYGNTQYPDRYTFAQCAKQWQATHDVVMRDKQVTRNFLEIRYEDLTERPKETLQKITDFIGIEPFPESVYKQEFAIHGLESPLKNQNPSSFNRLTPEAIAEIESVAGDALRYYGYLGQYE